MMDLQVLLLVGFSEADVAALVAGLTEDSVISCLPVATLAEVEAQMDALLPDLVLLYAEALEETGEDVVGFCERYRAMSPAQRPVFIVQTAAMEVRRIEYFLSGADDIFPADISPEELRVRLLVHLRRSLNAHTHAVTMLPGLVFAEKLFQRRLNREQPWAVAVVEIDHFGVYSEVYGALPANQVLRTFTAMLAKTILLPDFVCQSETDDFVLLSHPDRVEKVANLLCRQFEAAAPNFYSEKDRKQGYMISVAEEGTSRRVPLLSLSIGIVTSQTRSATSFSAAYSTALEMKALARRLPGSHWMSERPRLSGEPVTRALEKPAVLVVESDAALAFLLQTTLEMQGYAVEVVGSRADAKTSLSERPVGLVILDALLHGVPEGLALAREIKVTTPETKILCVSTLHDRDQVLKAGADLYLPKPFELVSLFTWIERLLQGQ